MKVLKFALKLILGIVIIALIAALFIKKELAINKEIVINKPKQDVFNYIKFLNNQDKYSKWATLDSTMKKSFSGTDGMVGFISRWEGNNDVGKGEQEIKKIVEGERLDVELRFEKPMKSVNDAFMTTTSISENITKVNWGFTGKMTYPFNLLRIFFDVEKEIGNDYIVGLENLKKVLEK